MSLQLHLLSSVCTLLWTRCEVGTFRVRSSIPVAVRVCNHGAHSNMAISESNQLLHTCSSPYVLILDYVLIINMCISETTRLLYSIPYRVLLVHVVRVVYVFLYPHDSLESRSSFLSLYISSVVAIDFVFPLPCAVCCVLRYETSKMWWDDKRCWIICP